MAKNNPVEKDPVADAQTPETAVEETKTPVEKPVEAAKEPEVTAEVVTESQDEEPALKLVDNAIPVTMHRCQLEDEVNNRFRVTVKQGVTPEQCMAEGFWCHLTTRLAPGDTLIVRPDDSTWELVLNVVSNGSNYVHVHKKVFYDLVPAMPRAALPSIYKVDFAGPIHKWRFLREGRMMRDGFATESLAVRAAKQHEMAVNRSAPK